MSEVKLKFTADTGEAINGINKVKSALGGIKSQAQEFAGGLKSGFTGMMGTITAITASLAGVTAATVGFSKGIKGIIDLSGSLKDMKDLTGLSISKVIQLKEEFRAAGIDAGKAEQILAKFSNNLSDPSAGVTSWLVQLGISLQDLESLTIDQKFELIRNKIGAVDDVAKRLAITADLFGGKNVGLARLFGDAESQENAKRFLGELPQVMAAIAPTLEPIGDVLDGLDIKKNQFFAGAASQLLKPIEDATGKLIDLDLTNIGKQVGAFVRDLIDAIRKGDIWGLIIPGIVAGLHKLVNEFITFFAYVFYAGIELAVDKMAQSKLFSPVLRALGYPDSGLKYKTQIVRNKGSFWKEGFYNIESAENPNYVPLRSSLQGKEMDFARFRKESLEYLNVFSTIAPGGKAAFESGIPLSKNVAAGATKAIKDLKFAEKAFDIMYTSVLDGTSTSTAKYPAIDILKNIFGGGLSKATGKDMIPFKGITKGVLKGGNLMSSAALISLPILSHLGESIFKEMFPGKILDLPKVAPEFLPVDKYKSTHAVSIMTPEIAQMEKEKYANAKEFQELMNQYLIPGYMDKDSFGRGAYPFDDTIGKSLGGNLLKKTGIAIQGFIPNLTSLAKKGGAAAEIGANAFVSYQKESVKHLVSLDNQLRQLYELINTSVVLPSNATVFQ